MEELNGNASDFVAFGFYYCFQQKNHKMPFITSIISDFNYINENLIQLVMCSIIRSYLIINLKL